jgi:hypothetical protein
MSKQLPDDMKSLSAFYVFSVPNTMQHFQHNGWNRSKDSVVCISKLGIITASTDGKSTLGDQSEVRFLAKARDFPLFQSIQTLLGLASFLNGPLFFFPGVKQPWCKIDHITPSSAKANNEWNYTPTPKYPSCHEQDQLSFLYYNNDLNFMTSYSDHNYSTITLYCNPSTYSRFDMKILDNWKSYKGLLLEM